MHQIKEKFGTLRYYCAPSGEPTPEMFHAFDDITTEAEWASAITCETLRRTGALHETRHLFKTLCTACANKHGYTSVPRNAT